MIIDTRYIWADLRSWWRRRNATPLTYAEIQERFIGHRRALEATMFMSSEASKQTPPPVGNDRPTKGTSK